MPVGVKASSPFEDQGICVALATTTIDDEVLAATHCPGLSRGMPAVCSGGGGLPAPVLCLPLGPGGVAGGRCWPVCSDFGGGVMAISQWQIIPSRSHVFI